MEQYVRFVHTEATDKHIPMTNGIRDNWCDCARLRFGATK